VQDSVPARLLLRPRRRGANDVRERHVVRRALGGEYTLRFGVAETAAHGMGFAETKFVVA
jgi:hypothetical protein